MPRKTATAWKPGQSGNPKGRPKGVRNRATMIALASMEGELDAIVKRVIEAAKAGDMVAARLVVDKLIPAVKDRPVRINLPQITDVATCNQAQAQITASVASGDLLLSEGEALAGLVEHQRRALETHDLAKRVEALEKQPTRKNHEHADSQAHQEVGGSSRRQESGQSSGQDDVLSR
jgi:hypothetical protein